MQRRLPVVHRRHAGHVAHDGIVRRRHGARCRTQPQQRPQAARAPHAAAGTAHARAPRGPWRAARRGVSETRKRAVQQPGVRRRLLATPLAALTRLRPPGVQSTPRRRRAAAEATLCGDPGELASRPSTDRPRHRITRQDVTYLAEMSHRCVRIAAASRARERGKRACARRRVRRRRPSLACWRRRHVAPFVPAPARARRRPQRAAPRIRRRRMRPGSAQSARGRRCPRRARHTAPARR